jgi:hypothetical protein
MVDSNADMDDPFAEAERLDAQAQRALDEADRARLPEDIRAMEARHVTLAMAVQRLHEEVRYLQAVARRWRVSRRRFIRWRRRSNGCRPSVRLALVYVPIIFCLLLMLTFVMIKAWPVVPIVEITFSVGEVIGALLAGIGVLLAGGAYAYKSLNPPDRPRPGKGPGARKR